MSSQTPSAARRREGEEDSGRLKHTYLHVPHTHAPSPPAPPPHLQLVNLGTVVLLDALVRSLRWLAAIRHPRSLAACKRLKVGTLFLITLTNGQEGMASQRYEKVEKIGEGRE